MTEPTTASRPAGDAPARALRRVNLYHVIVLALALAAVLSLTRLLEGSSFVDRLTVVNPTVYDVAIEATDADRDGWVAVGTARRSTTSTFEEIVDQGDVWIFRFSAQAEDAGEFRITRRELERDDWRFHIPEQVAAALADTAAQPPP